MRIFARGLSLAVLLFVFGLAPAASAVTIDWTFVGNPNNACETQSEGCFGAVGTAYYIGTAEVTNSQYAEFLNAKAAADPLALYSEGMGTEFGGITRTGSSGAYSYSAIAGRANMPVNFVSFYDTLRFANWLNNGQGSGDTETGAYTLIGGTATPSNGTTVTRNAGATTFLTSEDEWYKAAYHNALGLAATDYFDYPAGSNAQTTCSGPPGPNHANCGAAVEDLTVAGNYFGSDSPHGTFDQGGNVAEWNEAIIGGSSRGVRGGSFLDDPFELSALARNAFREPGDEDSIVGFRVAPEPGTGLLRMTGLLMTGLLGLAHRRKRST